MGAGLGRYDFPGVTGALHSFWLHDVCDVYLEQIKPVLGGAGDAAERAQAARHTLFAVLDTGLRLTAPLMPFLSEELWLRLYGQARSQQPPAASIALAAYPQPAELAHERDPELEANVAGLLSCTRAVRRAIQVQEFCEARKKK